MTTAAYDSVATMRRWEAARVAAARARATADHYVYRLYAADGTCLYVGCSLDVEARLLAHRRKQWWSLVVREELDGPYPGRAAGERAETVAIAAERPLYALSKQQVGHLGAAGRRRALARGAA